MFQSKVSSFNRLEFNKHRYSLRLLIVYSVTWHSSFTCIVNNLKLIQIRFIKCISFKTSSLVFKSSLATSGVLSLKMLIEVKWLSISLVVSISCHSIISTECSITLYTWSFQFLYFVLRKFQTKLHTRKQMSSYSLQKLLNDVFI